MTAPICDRCYLPVDEPHRWRHANCAPPPLLVSCQDCGTRYNPAELVDHYRRVDGVSECHRRRTMLQVVR